MTEKEVKSKYKRIVRYKRFRRFVFDFKKNKLVKDKWQTGIGYHCECGCKMFGNWDLYLVDKVPMSMGCILKRFGEMNGNTKKIK